jgi:hypothetical protein
MTWMYKGAELNEDDIPEKAIGFIYIIKQISTKKFYIGKKLLTKSATKVVAGKKKKTRKESDWKNYWSSSPWLKEYIKENGTSDFSKEILVFCLGKGSLLYAEELALYSVGALESIHWMNDNIRSKVYRNWVKPDEATELRDSLKKLDLLL